MRYFTIAEIAAHVGVTAETVLDSCRANGVELERIPSCRGYRVKEKSANQLIAKKWRARGPLPIPQLS